MDNRRALDTPNSGRQAPGVARNAVSANHAWPTTAHDTVSHPAAGPHSQSQSHAGSWNGGGAAYSHSHSHHGHPGYQSQYHPQHHQPYYSNADHHQYGGNQGGYSYPYPAASGYNDYQQQYHQQYQYQYQHHYDYDHQQYYQEQPFDRHGHGHGHGHNQSQSHHAHAGHYQDQHFQQHHNAYNQHYPQQSARGHSYTQQYSAQDRNHHPADLRTLAHQGRPQPPGPSTSSSRSHRAHRSPSPLHSSSYRRNTRHRSAAHRSPTRSRSRSRSRFHSRSRSRSRHSRSRSSSRSRSRSRPYSHSGSRHRRRSPEYHSHRDRSHYRDDYRRHDDLPRHHHRDHHEHEHEHRPRYNDSPDRYPSDAPKRKRTGRPRDKNKNRPVTNDNDDHLSRDSDRPSSVFDPPAEYPVIDFDHELDAAFQRAMSAFPTAAAATASAATAAATKSARTLLILDLNGCLMTRLNHQEFHAARKSGFPLPAKAGLVAKKPVFMRPHAVEFVRYVQAMPELDVAVWTSATAKNAAILIDMVLGPKTFDQFKFVWGREKCTPVQNEDTPWATIKDLAAIYKAFPHYTPERTLIVDDSLYKARLNAANALVLPSFDLIHPRAAPLADTVLLDLAAYLRLLVRVDPEDVRKYIHTNPFSLLVNTPAPAPSATPAPEGGARTASPAKRNLPANLTAIPNPQPDFSAPIGYLPPKHVSDAVAGDMSASLALEPPTVATATAGAAAAGMSSSWIDLTAAAKDAAPQMDADDDEFWEQVSKVSLSSEASSEAPSGAASPLLGNTARHGAAEAVAVADVKATADGVAGAEAPTAAAGRGKSAGAGEGSKGGNGKAAAVRKLDWSDF